MENFHLTEIGDTWHLIKEGAAEAALTFPTREEALASAEKYLSGKEASLTIHGEDGIVEEERNYPVA